MRLIDADEIKKVFGIGGDEISCKNCKYLGRYGCIKEIPINYVCGFIDDAPTVDAVPVVRCKDCIYYHPFAEIKGKGECHIIEDAEYFPWYEDCDYCSYGERRSEDETH